MDGTRGLIGSCNWEAARDRASNSNSLQEKKEQCVPSWSIPSTWGVLLLVPQTVENLKKGCFKVVDEVKESNGKIVLFIDELHTLIAAGTGSGQTLDASNILKLDFGRGQLKCIGATTLEEYMKHIEKDRSCFEKAFPTIGSD
ncbi:hypothetical protein U1Q18_021868 [Sarracenia purpurea var. burkii]